jgi:hypothetical protein
MESTQFTHSQYPFLKELGIGEVNGGVYRNGEWTGNGADYIAVNPHNNKPIAKIRLGNE